MGARIRHRKDLSSMTHKKYFIIFSFAASLLNISFPEAADPKAFLDHCLDSYVSTNVCPKEICELKCPQVSPNCTQICLPKECTKIKAENCPLEYCAVMTDCSNEKICHYQMLGEKPECGDLAYAGQDVECCEGLVKRCGVAFLDGNCDMEGKNSIY